MSESPPPSSDSVSPPVDAARLSPPVGRQWCWLLVPVPLAFFWLFAVRPDALAALTVIPIECWLIGGIVLQGLTFSSRRRRPWQFASGMWILAAVLWLEFPLSLGRQLQPVLDVPQGFQRLRIVSLNAHLGSKGALQDLIAQQPDVVLLQESPGRALLDAWGQALFGDSANVVWSSDSSIIARGRLTPVELPEEAAFVLAVWEPFPGVQLDVVSLRLWPQPLRFDYWNAENWNSYTQVRQRQREQVEYLCDVLRDRSRQRIVGGDFNCSPGDPAEHSLSQVSVTDSFRNAGRGWGKTIINEAPFHRIDRVFLSPGLSVADVRAVRTAGSDHRLVRCEVDIPLIP